MSRCVGQHEADKTKTPDRLYDFFDLGLGVGAGVAPGERELLDRAVLSDQFPSTVVDVIHCSFPCGIVMGSHKLDSLAGSQAARGRLPPLRTGPAMPI